MKNINLFLSFFFILFAFSCSDNEDGNADFINDTSGPINVNALFTITQDNTGLVTITPNGEGANSFSIIFGDGTTPATVLPGQNVQHVYAEGVYEVKIQATSLNGLMTEASKSLTVSFKAPENLEVTIEKDPTDNFGINLSATADLETFFEVFFGDVENETPTMFNEGDVVNHKYPAVGDYTVRVVAFGGGEATAELSQVVTITNPLLLPVNFESTTLNYNFIDFEGAVTTVIDNPDASGANTTTKVAQFLKNQGAQFFAGSILTLDQPIDFSQLKKIKIKVWSPKSGIIVKLKLENATDPNVSTELDVRNTVANQWEELIFDFGTLTNGKQLSKLIYFFDFENGGDGATYFFDEIEQTNASPEPIALPLTFESTTLTFDWVGFGDANFGPIPAAVVNNPNPSGINTSSKVLEINKTGGAQVWAGASLNLTNPIDFGLGTTVKVKVWSPRAGTPILLKIEDSNSPLDGNGNPTVFVEVVVNATVANAWQEISFDLTSSSAFSTANSYDRVILFPDFGNGGNGELFFFDDIAQVGANTPSISLPLDFESSALTFDWTGFGSASFGPIPAAVVNNPNPSGINTSSKVVEIEKLGGAQVWAGASLNLSGPINFASGTTAKVKVWSPRVGTPILFKIEDSNSPKDGNGNPTVFVEVQATSTVANAWQELSFDLTSFGAFSTANSYDRVILFPDFGNGGNGEMFYFDDISLSGQSGGGGGSNPPSLIEDFQGVAPVFTSFGNIPTSTVVNNPNQSGINISSLVGELVKAQGSEIWAGSFIENKVIDVASLPYIRVKVLSPKSGIVIKVKIENIDGSVTHEVDVTNTKANVWEELSYNFSGAPTANYVRFVIFFDFGKNGDGTIYHFDDISLASTAAGTSGGGGTGGGSGTGGSGTPPRNPIDFEPGGFGANWTWTVFENGSNPPVEIVANPDASGINTSATVLKATALQVGQPWVGFESKHGADIGSFTFDQTNKIVRIMVWKSVISDVGLKFAESNGEAQPEVKVANTKINQWEELTFDLSGSIGKGITGIIDQIIIFPDFDLSGRTSDHVIYIDNIRFSNQ